MEKILFPHIDTIFHSENNSKKFIWPALIERQWCYIKPANQSIIREFWKWLSVLYSSNWQH
jgi:hypothetical protein